MKKIFPLFIIVILGFLGVEALQTPPSRLVKAEYVPGRACEISPLNIGGKIVDFCGIWGKPPYLCFRDPDTGKTLSKFGEGYGYPCAISGPDGIYVFASRVEGKDYKDVTQFHTRDYQCLSQKTVLKSGPNENFYNTSVCKADGKYVMAVEVYGGGQNFFTKFAASTDLENWEFIPGAVYLVDQRTIEPSEGLFPGCSTKPKSCLLAGKEIRTECFQLLRYAGCPLLRYHDGFYYLIQLEMIVRSRLIGYSQNAREWFMAPNQVFPIDSQNGQLMSYQEGAWIFLDFLDQKRYVSNGMRSKDLVKWEDSPRNPLLFPTPEEGINNSDLDMVEKDGQLLMYYFTGNQVSTGTSRTARFDGSEKEFFQWCFTEGSREAGAQPRPELGFWALVLAGNVMLCTGLYLLKRPPKTTEPNGEPPSPPLGK